MVASTSRLSYKDCFELMDRALADDRGIRVKFLSGGDAWSFRLRLNAARVIDRKENVSTYDEEHPMYGVSIYDRLISKIRKINGQVWLYIERLDAIEYELESLSDEREEDVIDEPNASDNGPASREIRSPQESEVESIKRRI